MAYASGKFALGLCDRCGFEYKLHELKEEWNKFKTCPECFEPKAPQLEPTPTVISAEALYKPRPNNDKEVGEGFVVVTSSSIFQADFMNPSILGSNFTIDEMTSSLGTVTITT
jgi:hypothetical protein|tara:strand:+ start:1051 stop:1389 length:339 start_codon:yes stop_codon:yes gene_type:complete